jgi:hypothetical protein
MNEPKRRGRPPKISGAAADHAADHIKAIEFAAGVDEFARRQAQAYANRVWKGQSVSEPRAWRLARVEEALKGQGLSMEGVEL